jgi:hypothetical protein
MSHELQQYVARLEEQLAFERREKEKTVQLLRQWDQMKARIAKRDREIARLKSLLPNP